MSEYPDDQSERTLQAWIKSHKTLESERDALKAELEKVRMEASGGLYTPQVEAEYQRTRAMLSQEQARSRRLMAVLDTIVYIKTQCWCGECSKGNPIPQCVHCFAKAALEDSKETTI